MGSGDIIRNTGGDFEWAAVDGWSWDGYAGERSDDVLLLGGGWNLTQGIW